MGLFSFTQEIAVDLGTANTIIIHNDKIVIDEPSVVALDTKTGKLIAVGERAREMHGKVHEGIRTVRPLRDGVIADFNAAEMMIRGLIKKVSSKNHWFSPSLRMVVCIPSGSTEVEIRAVRDSAEHANGRDVYMIYEPMAAALGIGLDDFHDVHRNLDVIHAVVQAVPGVQFPSGLNRFEGTVLLTAHDLEDIPVAFGLVNVFHRGAPWSGRGKENPSVRLTFRR